MRHIVRRWVIALTIVLLAASVWAADVPWKKDKADDAQDDTAPATIEQMKTELTEARFKRIIGPIEAKVKAAEAAMERYDKEMRQPPDKRRQNVLSMCKEQAAKMYAQASMTAKRAQGLVQKKSHQLGIKKNYEDPYMKKAVDILLGLAADARSERRMMQSVGYYKGVLGLDPDNEQAKTALKELQEEYRQAMQDRARRGKSTGGSHENQNEWDWDYDSEHNKDWGSWREHSGTKGLW